MKKYLSAKDIAPISSTYLNSGRKEESWEIRFVEIEGDRLRAEVIMTSIHVSPTDNHGFHLTIFSTLEFLSQLMIIYVHDWCGAEQKTLEGWMVESRTRSVRAIRNPHRIVVDMDVRRMKKHGDTVYCVAEFAVTDDDEGLFEVTLKGLLS